MSSLLWEVTVVVVFYNDRMLMDFLRTFLRHCHMGLSLRIIESVTFKFIWYKSWEGYLLRYLWQQCLHHLLHPKPTFPDIGGVDHIRRLTNDQSFTLLV